MISTTVYIFIGEGELDMSAVDEGGGDSLGNKNSFFDTVVCHPNWTSRSKTNAILMLRV